MRRAVVSGLWAACFVLALPVVGPASAQPSFGGLGAPSGQESHALGVSADGCFVAGSTAPGSGSDALRWGPDGIEVLAPAGWSGPGGVARALSGDGAVAVGSGTGDDPVSQLFPWPLAWDAGVGVALAALPGLTGELHAVSSDGRVVVGSLERVDHTREGFRWEAGVFDILTPAPTFPDGRGTGVSGDGSVAVGWGVSGGSRRAVRWEAGVVSLVPLLPGETSNEATAISSDAGVIVGTSGANAFRFESPVLLDLGAGAPSDLSADGDVVVGNDTAPWIWTPGGGRRDLATALVNEWGLDLSGWSLDAATGVSDDGLVIVGTGTNPGGGVEAWKAVLGTLACPGDPPPSPPPARLPAIAALVTQAELFSAGYFDDPAVLAVAPDATSFLGFDFAPQIVEVSPAGALSLFNATQGNNLSLIADAGQVTSRNVQEVVHLPRGGGEEPVDLQALLGVAAIPDFLASDAGGVVYASTEGGGCFGAAAVTPHGYAKRLRTIAFDPCFLPGPALVRFHPTGLVFASASLVQRLDAAGQFTTILDGSGGGLLESPASIAVDGPGNVYVTGLVSNNVVKVEPGGAASQILGPGGDLQGHPLASPTAVAVDARSHVFVAHGTEPWVYEVLPNGIARVILDEAGDGQGNPLDEVVTELGVDARGNVYALSREGSVKLFGIPPGPGLPSVPSLSPLGLVALVLSLVAVGRIRSGTG